MLSISLFAGGDFLMIGDDIEVRIIKARGGGVRLGLWLPPEIKVLRGAVIVRRVIERGGDVDAMLRSIPSARAGWKGHGPAYKNVMNSVASDAAFWNAEAEANERVAM